VVVRSSRNEEYIVNKRNIARRDFLLRAGSGIVALTLAPMTVQATPRIVENEIRKLTGGKTAAEARIKLTLPAIAENARVVPIRIHVDSPMKPDDYVKAVHVFADGNPLPGVASYRFGPQNGRAEFSLRIRLAKTQKIVALAEMNDDRFFLARHMIKVTLGGCGG
jgi:sulfur-oxidizing protein SoxY